jgi:organic radical activating enzyme
MAQQKTTKKTGSVPYPAKIIRPEEGNVAGIYSAIQGEGTMVGERQLFIRLGGCPFRCHYCDTPEALIPSQFCRVEDPPGERKFRKISNPVAPEKLAELAKPFLEPGGHHRAVVLTGGEPLWQAAYLKNALPAIRAFGRRIYLETAGAHVDELKSVLSLVDIVAMDMKPPSSTGMKPMWAQHREFLKVALPKQVMVKVVVTRSTSLFDLEQVREIVSEVDRTIAVILQPLAPAWKAKKPPTPAQLYMWQGLLSEKLENVRVIPQCHKILGDL